MRVELLTDLIGHSVHHPDVKAVLKDFGVLETPVAKIPNEWSIDIPRITNNERTLTLVFTTRIACQELKSSFTDDKFELILNGIDFWKLSDGITYPFNLTPGDPDKIINTKLATKPQDKRKSLQTGFVYWYYKGPFEIIVRLDDFKRIETFSVQLQDALVRKSVELRETFQKQQPNLTTAHLDELKQLSSDLPTRAWIVRMSEEDEEAGESPFTSQNIQAAETVLKDFIFALEVAATNKKISQIKAAIKKTVVGFNKLNEKHNYYIETLEREELVEFMTKAIRLTGFKVEEGADITEPWREW